MARSSKVLIDTSCVENEPLFSLLLRDHETSDGRLSSGPERHQTTRTHITNKSGIAPRFPFEHRVSMRINSPFERDHFLKLAWRAKQNPAPFPPSFQVRASQETRTVGAIVAPGSGRSTRPSLKVACLTLFVVYPGTKAL